MKEITLDKQSFDDAVKNYINGFSVTWCTGGVDGGNCWAESNTRHYTLEGESEPIISDLDDFLTTYIPDLRYSQYKQIDNKITYSTSTHHEYYGNYTTHSTKTLTLDDLWGVLCSFS